MLNSLFTVVRVLPCDAIAVTRVLVVLEVTQNRRLHGDVEVVGLVRPHRHKTGAHHKAVHLTRDGAVHVGNLVQVKVVACREVDVPVLGGPDRTVKTQVLRPFALVLELVLVKTAITIVERVVYSETPGALPLRIAVGAQFSIATGLLSRIIRVRLVL